jgi:hypothetical protein
MMGFLSGMLGNASEVDTQKLETEIANLLIPGETVDLAYKLIRDTLIFTNRRLMIVDKQGMTGKKAEYQSIPYKSIVRFSVETAGHFDLDAELKIYISGESMPIQHQFKKGASVLDVQRTLAQHILGN